MSKFGSYFADSSMNRYKEKMLVFKLKLDILFNMQSQVYCKRTKAAHLLSRIQVSLKYK